jgi:pimeloyl-ACP methyl ester carboxylesterase
MRRMAERRHVDDKRLRAVGDAFGWPGQPGRFPRWKKKQATPDRASTTSPAAAVRRFRIRGRAANSIRSTMRLSFAGRAQARAAWPCIGQVHRQQQVLQVARPARIRPVRRYMAEIWHPHLVLWGERDGWIALADLRTMAAAVPDCRLITVPGIGQSMNRESPSLYARPWFGGLSGGVVAI